MDTILLKLWLLLGFPILLEAFNCLKGCGFTQEHPLVAPRDSKNQCLVTLPDNPRVEGATTFPCQIEIQTNCTSFCVVHLQFHKFNMDTCQKNLTRHDEVCSQVNKCEYVVLREHGVTRDGNEIDEIVRFHGNRTEDIFVSQTNKVLLQFCYRSATFSARNMQILYKAIDPTVNKSIDWGPPAAYVMGTFVVLFIIAIFMVQFCPWLRPCLDPQPQKDNLMMDL